MVVTLDFRHIKNNNPIAVVVTPPMNRERPSENSNVVNKIAKDMPMNTYAATLCHFRLSGLRNMR
jgi:hypothetical protein